MYQRNTRKNRCKITPCLFFLISSLSAFLANASPVRIPEHRQLSKGQIRLSADYRRDMTKENYNGNAKREEIEGLNSFNRNLLDTHLTWGVHSRWTAYGRLSYLQSRFETSSPQTPTVGSASGIYEIGLGSTFRLFSKKNTNPNRPEGMDLVVDFNFPTYDPSKMRSAQTGSDSIPGDGANEYSLIGFYTKPFTKDVGAVWMLRGGFGVMVRNGGYSSATLWQGSLIRDPIVNGFYFLAGFHSQISMSPDTDGNVRTVPNYSSLDSGNSFIVGPKNSSYVYLRMLLGWQWKSGYLLTTGLGNTFLGRSTANINSFMLGLSIPLGEPIRTTGEPTRTAEDPSQQPAADPNTIPQLPSEIYDLEGSITQANEALRLIKIDKGAAQGVLRDQLFDVFRTDEISGESKLIARGKVTQLGSTESILTIFKYQPQAWVRPGYIVKRIAE